MDPITGAIIAALAAGFAEGAGATLYNALKDAITNKYGADSKIAQAVAAVEQEPEFEPHHAALAGRVEQTGAAQDPHLRELAASLKAALEKTAQGQAVLSKYHLHIQNSEVGVIGDHTNIEGGIHFGKPPH